MRKRKKFSGIRRGIVELLDLPSEAVENTVRITALGQSHMLIENHRGIFEYGPNKVRVSAGAKMLNVHGDALVLRELSSNRLYIAGEISGFSYE